MLVGHAPTVEACTRQLVGGRPRPADEFISITRKVPFLSMAQCEKNVLTGKWFLGPPPVPSMRHMSLEEFDWTNLNPDLNTFISNTVNNSANLLMNNLSLNSPSSMNNSTLNNNNSNNIPSNIPNNMMNNMMNNNSNNGMNNMMNNNGNSGMNTMMNNNGNNGMNQMNPTTALNGQNNAPNKLDNNSKYGYNPNNLPFLTQQQWF